MPILKNLIKAGCLWLILSYTSRAAADNKPIFPFPDLPETELWYVTLEMDLQSLYEQKKTDTYHKARFSFKDDDGELVHWDIKVRARGRFRRMRCGFPPLKLKFPKQKMQAAGFGRHNDVKLVTHCGDDKQALEYLYREYLAYRLYAELTEISLRTQMIQITYRDSETGEEMTTYGMFIEDVDALAERLNVKECKPCYGFGPEDFEASNLRIHDLFQYMISNIDWSIMMHRNMKIFDPVEEVGQKLIVPYDFDFSGLVNADYALLDPKYDQTSLRERIYIGPERSAAEWAETIQLFQDKREALMDIVDGMDLLTRKARRDIRQFLNEFYKLLDSGRVPGLAVAEKKD